MNIIPKISYKLSHNIETLLYNLLYNLIHYTIYQKFSENLQIMIFFNLTLPK